ncbi:hypothetical protein C8R42DRAFT_642782 [Lentinula raphanica]|nr:hypothetical protein C8R42DRAFT_642782 [Lentinula raphanica]
MSATGKIESWSKFAPQTSDPCPTFTGEIELGTLDDSSKNIVSAVLGIMRVVQDWILSLLSAALYSSSDDAALRFPSARSWSQNLFKPLLRHPRRSPLTSLRGLGFGTKITSSTNMQEMKIPGWFKKFTIIPISRLIPIDLCEKAISSTVYQTLKNVPRGSGNTKKGILNHAAEASTYHPSRKATPVSFEPLEKPPKYFMEGNTLPIVDNGVFGPTKLQSSNFNSKDSQGITAWHYSQSPTDLDSPLPETPTPSKLGTVYIHRNTRDGGYQIWVWLTHGDQEKWQPVDLSGPLIHHPDFPSRVLTIQASTGNPSWVLHKPRNLVRHAKVDRSSVGRLEVAIVFLTFRLEVRFWNVQTSPGAVSRFLDLAKAELCTVPTDVYYLGQIPLAMQSLRTPTNALFSDKGVIGTHGEEVGKYGQIETDLNVKSTQTDLSGRGIDVAQNFANFKKLLKTTHNSSRSDASMVKFISASEHTRYSEYQVLVSPHVEQIITKGKLTEVKIFNEDPLDNLDTIAITLGLSSCCDNGTKRIFTVSVLPDFLSKFSKVGCHPGVVGPEVETTIQEQTVPFWDPAA